MTDLPHPDSTTVPPSKPRLMSLDAFRGLTIAGMILVNNPGSWDQVYPPLLHAEWHGLTPTDLVFPFFLLIMGTAIPLALASRRERGASVFGLILKILWRSLVIFGLGLALNGFPEYDLQTLRIPGVLQRIAVCYLFASLLFLICGPRLLTAMTVLLLVGYSAAMALVPVPGIGTGDLSREGNLAAYLDRLLLAGHIYKTDYDPEGILSTLPALATALIGVLAGRWLRSGRSSYEINAGILASGVLLVLTGYFLSAGIPVNKALWTAPFVLLTGGLGLLGFGLFYWLIDLQAYRKWSVPLLVFGVNPIAAYVLSGLGARFLGMIKVSGPEGDAISLKAWLVERLLSLGIDPMNASLLFSLGFVLTWLLIMSLFYRYRIIIRV